MWQNIPITSIKLYELPLESAIKTARSLPNGFPADRLDDAILQDTPNRIYLHQQITSHLLNLRGIAEYGHKIPKMTVQQAGGGGICPPNGASGVLLQPPPRSRFMITDILSGGGQTTNVMASDRGILGSDLGIRDHGSGRSPSPRDLTLHRTMPSDRSQLESARRHSSDHALMDESDDDDSSGPMDSGSVCSNGKCSTLMNANFTNIDSNLIIMHHIIFQYYLFNKMNHNKLF